MTHTALHRTPFTTTLFVALTLGAASCTAGAEPSPGWSGAPGAPDGPDDPAAEPSAPGSDPSSPGTPGSPWDEPYAFFPLTLLAVVNAIDVDDYAMVLELDEDGAIRATGARVTLPQSPRAVAASPDGSEFAVVHGLGPRMDEGVMILGVSATGDRLTLVQDLRLGSDFSPQSVLYASNDTLLVSFQGPDGGRLMTLRREGNHGFRPGPFVDVGGGARQLASLPEDDRALLLRSDLLEGGAELLVLGPEGEDWGVVSRSGMLPDEPIEMASSPDGSKVYVPLYDPSDVPSPYPTGPRSGLLYVFGRSADGASYAAAREPLSLPSGGLLLTTALDDNVGVVASPNPATDSYGLLTLEMDADGMPMHLGPPMSSIPGVLMTELRLVPGGFLVTGALEAGRSYSLRVLEETRPGAWTEVSALPLDGSLQALAIARDPGPA
jgi:hypothetical protein